jgi:hypothetical protein
MNVTVVERPTIRVAACRHIGAYSRISEAFARLHAIAAPACLLREGAGSWASGCREAASAWATESRMRSTATP